MKESDEIMTNKRFYSIEWLTFTYILSTLVYVLIFYSHVHDFAKLIHIRLFAVTFICFSAYLSNKKGWHTLDGIRQLMPFLLLGYWYSETYYLSNLFVTNKDPFFFNLEQWLFHGQPSLAFSRIFPMRWFSEIMFFGYFSYYMLLLGVPLWIWIRKPGEYDKLVFVLLCSFFLYYLIYDFLPVGGPQFFFRGKDALVPEGYLFYHLVRMLQGMGEMPTAAFPSSHVGITCILLMFTVNRDRKLFFIILPIALILMCSTVYIKAHYLIDVLGGLVSAVFLYILSGWIYDISLEHRLFRIPARLEKIMNENSEK